MKTLFWIWTACCILGAGFLIWVSNQSQNYTGTDITVLVSEKNFMVIDTESVTMEAANDAFFAIREARGEATMVGKSFQKPLGWSKNAYFKAEAHEVPGGKWIVEKGNNVTIHLVGSKSMQVVVDVEPETKAMQVFSVVIMTCLVWVFGIILVAVR